MMVDRVFGDQIGRNVEAYVHDIVIQSKDNSNLEALQKTFSKLRKNKMKINPSKCVFAVVAGEFFGFVIIERAIEANPEKI